jgi:hypothetical protein
MKYLILLFGLFACTTVIAQKKLNRYVELRARVDALGNIYFDGIAIPKKLANQVDSLVDYKQINSLIYTYREPVKILNALSEVGWEIVSVTQIASDKEGRPNSPFILYYLKKEFTTGETQR